jgi:uncharacterized sulfatase
MKLLDELGLSERTVIIFFSDYGYNMGHNGIKHKGNGIWVTKHIHDDTENFFGKYRPNLYDNSLKVPAIVCWPGVINPGTVIHHTISSLDIYPTILDLAGAEIPVDHEVRGRSFLPMLRGEETEEWNDVYYGEYSMIKNCRAFMRCYRTPGWKLVLGFLNPESDELYHIAYDPQENINLMHDHREEIQKIVDNLHRKILQKMEEINDPLLKEVTIDKYFINIL